METKIRMLLIFTGICRVSSALTNDYYFVNVTLNWTEAQSYCRETYNDLAIIENNKDTATVISKLANVNSGKVWIGFYYPFNGWKWSLDNPTFYKDGEMDFRSWDVGQPGYLRDLPTCTVSYSLGTWSARRCNESHNYVCYDDTSGTYKYIFRVETWNAAQKYCRTTYTDLASARNQQENMEIAAKMFASNRSWIGLSAEPWSWSDQSNSTYRNWATGQPNNMKILRHCAAVDSTGTWSDEDCTNSFPFLCSGEEGKRLKIRMKLQSVADMTNPEVQLQVQQQLQARLKNLGVSDVNLSWNECGQINQKDEEEKK